MNSSDNNISSAESYLINPTNESIEINLPTQSAVEHVTSPVAAAFDLTDAEELHFITSGILGTIFVIFGTIGNILSIFVWIRKSMRSTTGTYLIALAIADLGELLFFFLTDSVQVLQPELRSSHGYSVFYSYLGYPVHMLFNTCSIWITVGMTADRCIKIRWIKQAQTMCSQRRALVSIGAIVLLCFLINIPHFMAYEIESKDGGNDTVISYKLTDFGITDGRHHYEFWIQCMLLVLIPVVSIFTFNMLIICQVRTVNRQIGSRKGSVGKRKGLQSEAQLTRLLLTVTFSFLVLNSFSCVVQCFGILNSGDPKIVAEAVKIATLGGVMNSSVNFLLYCVSGKRFRKEFTETICGVFGKTKDVKTSYTTATTTTTHLVTMTPKMKPARIGNKR